MPIIKKLGAFFEEHIERFSPAELAVLFSCIFIAFSDYWLGAFVCAVVLLSFCFKESRKAILSQKNAAVVAALLPLILLPAVFSGNMFGLAVGAVIWLIIAFMLLCRSVMTADFFDIVCDVLLAVSTAAAICAVACLVFGITVHGDRIQSVFENPNYFGYAIELFIVTAAYRFIRTKKPIYIVLAVINLACNILADCRTAWLAVFAALAVFVFCIYGKIWLPAAVCVTCAAGLLLASLLPGIGDRLSIESLSFAFDDRIGLWQNALRWIKGSPIFGYGAMAYRTLSAAEGFTAKYHCHSLYLNMPLDFGIVGTLGFIWLAIRSVGSVFLKTKNEQHKQLRALILSVFAATLVHGLTDVPVLGIDGAVLLVILLSSERIADCDIIPEKYNLLRKYL